MDMDFFLSWLFCSDVYPIIYKQRAVVLVQLAEQLLPISEVRSLNPDIGIFLKKIPLTVETTK